MANKKYCENSRSQVQRQTIYSTFVKWPLLTKCCYVTWIQRSLMGSALDCKVRAQRIESGCPPPHARQANLVNEAGWLCDHL